FFIVSTFVMGIGVIWLYAVARPRLGPGAKTATLTGFAFWLFAYAIPAANDVVARSEEHTSELQSRFDLVCRLLLEKKKETADAQWLRHAPFTHSSPPGRQTSDSMSDASMPASIRAPSALAAAMPDTTHHPAQNDRQ